MVKLHISRINNTKNDYKIFLRYDGDLFLSWMLEFGSECSDGCKSINAYTLYYREFDDHFGIFMYITLNSSKQLCYGWLVHVCRTSPRLKFNIFDAHL